MIILICGRPGAITFHTEWNHPMGNSYTKAFLALMLIQIMFLRLIMFFGEVIYPHCNDNVVDLNGMMITLANVGAAGRLHNITRRI